MKVFFDHNLSPGIARALDALFMGAHEVVALKDKFSQDITDEAWIRALNKEGKWTIISGDRRITRNKAERSVFTSSKLIGFFLSSTLKDAKVTIQMQRILAVWDEIQMLSECMNGGALFEIPRKSSKIKQIRL